jgi:hypothetical protein
MLTILKSDALGNQLGVSRAFKRSFKPFNKEGQENATQVFVGGLPKKATEG